MCCGNNRAAARAAAMASGSASVTRTAAMSVAPLSVIVFEYLGTGAASIRGPVSGHLYQFARPGDRLRIDPRDRPGLAASPSLRWIR
jgi:hypothetical protein